MPIPPFDIHGSLTIPEPEDGSGFPGHMIYSRLSLVPVSLSELHERFVVEIPDHAHRRRLWSGWMRLRREVERFGLPYATWMGGSFFTTQATPGDIDLCLIFEASDIGRMEPEQQTALVELLGRADAEEAYGCHVFTLVNYPVSHRRFVQSATGYSYWTRVFGVDRAGRQRSILLVTERGAYE